MIKKILLAIIILTAITPVIYRNTQAVDAFDITVMESARCTIENQVICD